jgi:hypothetical protein
MGLYSCPIATVHAPLDKLWGLLSDPSQYALWWDAETRSIEHPNPAFAGQKILAQTRAFGRAWDVYIHVDEVDTARHTIQLTTALPFGITVYNHIACISLNENSCRVTFG